VLVDANLLLYATFSDAPEHAVARRWLKGRLSAGGDGIALCWPALYAFVRLASSTRVFGAQALSVSESWSAADAYLAQPAARVITPGPRHRVTAAELAATPGLRSDDVPDIELAALAIEHGLVLASRDRGFRRFAGVRTFDPLT
jgi:toxin-antitoxin system PIN domain toxin